MEIINTRGALLRTKKALENKQIKLGFIGGSITEFAEYRSWTEPVINYIVSEYPDVRVSVRNSAIGATGSDYGVFHVDKEIISKNCDIVFVEYAVNDDGKDADLRMNSREGLIRKLIKSGCDVVLVYTYREQMYSDMEKGDVPKSIADFEIIAENYNISSVWMAKNAFDEYMNGNIRLEEWLPDGLHPLERGSMSYAKPVIEFLKKELSTDNQERIILNEPISPLNWENCAILDFNELSWGKPWRCRENAVHRLPGEFLDTSAPNAFLKFEFEGRGMAFVKMHGKRSANTLLRIDGQEWIDTDADSYVADWQGENGWHKVNYSGDLEYGKHVAEIKVVMNNLGSRCAIEMIGVVK